MRYIICFCQAARCRFLAYLHNLHISSFATILNSWSVLHHMEWIMPLQISVTLKLIKCMTTHQNWACTAQMYPGEQPPLELATFSKQLVEMQCYNLLENLRMCADSQETFWARLTVRASPQHFHLPACSHPQHCMTTLAAAILAGSCSPWRSHAIMHPYSHVVLNYTKKTRGCLGHTVFLCKRSSRKKQPIDIVCTRGDNIGQNGLVSVISAGKQDWDNLICG